MKKHRRLLTATSLLMIVLAFGLLTTASSGQPGDGQDQAREFIDLMDNYLGMSDRWVSLVSQQDTAVYLAIEGIIEVYEQRGEKAKAIPHLQAIIDQSSNDRALRNVARFKLRDLYSETGRSDKALEQLELIIQDNAK